MGSYKDAKSGQTTSDEKHAKRVNKRVYNDESDSENDSQDRKGKVVKGFIRTSIPHCVVCRALATTSEQAHRSSRSVWYCPTCNVHLCIATNGNSKHSCYQQWHNVKDCSCFMKNKQQPAIITPIRTSPRRRARTYPRRHQNHDEEEGRGGTHKRRRYPQRQRNKPNYKCLN